LPPKERITKEMIIDAAFDILSQQGEEAINVRAIAQKLGCSTQPVLYRFGSIEDIKREVYLKADRFHAEYITDIRGRYEMPMLEIGVLYIRFALEHRNLFRYLFQSDKFEHSSLEDLMAQDDLGEIIGIVAQAVETDEEKARDIFASLFLTAHGFASLLANNAMTYDEQYAVKMLNVAFFGAVGAAKGEFENNEKTS